MELDRSCISYFCGRVELQNFDEALSVGAALFFTLEKNSFSQTLSPRGGSVNISVQVWGVVCSPFLVVAAVAATTATAAATIAAAALCHFKWKACCLGGHFLTYLLFLVLVN